VVAVRPYYSCSIVPRLTTALQCHTDGNNCLIVSGTSSPGPSCIKVWEYTQPSVGRSACLGHNFDFLPPSQAQAAEPHQDITAASNYKVWQICLIVAIISFGVNQAVLYMQQMLQVLLVRILVAWDGAARGIPFVGARTNATKFA